MPLRCVSGGKRRCLALLEDGRMAGGRRGLVAPQNTFLENIVRRSNGKSRAGPARPRSGSVRQVGAVFPPG